MSRVEGILSRVEGKLSSAEGRLSRVVFFNSFFELWSQGFPIFGQVKNIPCKFYNNFHVGTLCCSYKAFE